MPHIYWDSDVAKVLEGMALASALFHDKEMEAKLDELVALVISAQQPDGYLNTHFTAVEPEKRWKNLFDWHELYCAVHLIEAAVARFNSSGKRDFLDAMCRYADLIWKEFGPDGRKGYPGHEELELALVKLYRVTGEQKYLELAKLFVDRRGFFFSFLWHLLANPIHHFNVKYSVDAETGDPSNLVRAKADARHRMNA